MIVNLRVDNFIAVSLLVIMAAILYTMNDLPLQITIRTCIDFMLQTIDS